MNITKNLSLTIITRNNFNNEKLLNNLNGTFLSSCETLDVNVGS